MKLFLTLIPVFTLLVESPSALAGDDSPFKRELKVTLLHGSDEDLYVPAVQDKLGYEKPHFPWLGSLDYYYAARSEGTVATDQRANSDNLFAEIEGGLNWEMTRVGTAPPPRTNTSAGVGMRFDEGDKGTEPVRFGNLMFTAVTRFETDQPFDNYNLTLGGGLGYVHRNGDTQPWWSLVPKVQLRYQYVEVLESRDFVRRGISEDAFWRLDALADWTFKVGKWIDPEYSRWYGGLGLHAELKHYRGFEMPKGAEAAGLDKTWYYSGGVNYRFKPGTSIAKWISFTYLTVGHGRIPPATKDQTQVFLGVAINFD